MFVRSDPEKIQTNRRRALVLLGKIVNGADTDNTLYQQPGMQPADGFAVCSRALRTSGLDNVPASLRRG
jgi:hypothetical protein